LSRRTAEEAATSLVTRHSLREEKRRVRILVAEDNLVVQELSKKILESRGHIVHVVPNGKKVLSELEKSRFDLILMDIQMPLMDGLEATAAIRNREKETDGHIPIVAMTGYAKKGDRERCLRSGMDAYVSKPIRKHELLAVIDALVSNSKMHGTENDNSEKAGKRDDSIRLQGDPVLVRKFLQNSQEWLTEIQIAIQTEDGHALGKAARSLKIGLANFESMEAFNAALRLEIMGRQKEYEKAKQVFDELKQEITRLEVDFASTKVEDLNEKP
jgi:CheY-like chemotaxis protein